VQKRLDNRPGRGPDGPRRKPTNCEPEAAAKDTLTPRRRFGPDDAFTKALSWRSRRGL